MKTTNAPRRWSWSVPAWSDTMVMWLVVLATTAGTLIGIAHALGLQLGLPSSQYASRAVFPLLLTGLAVLFTNHRIRLARSRKRWQWMLGGN